MFEMLRVARQRGWATPWASWLARWERIRGGFLQCAHKHRLALSGIGLALAAVAVLALPMAPGVDLDSGWKILLQVGYERGWQFGRDVVFTFGPLGSFYSPVYVRGAFWGPFWFAIAVAVTYSLALALLLFRFGRFSALPGVVFATLIATLYPDPIFIALTLSLGLSGIAFANRPLPLLPILCGLCTLALIKTSFAFLAFAAMAGIVACGAKERGARYGGALIGLSLLSFLGVWLVSGQGFGNLASFVSLARRFGTVYATDFQWPGPLRDLNFAGGALTLMALGLAAHVRHAKKRFEAAVQAGLVGFAGFLIWKAAFVRHDQHSLIFFGSFPFLIGVLFLGTEAPARSAFVRRWVLGLAMATSVVGLHWALVSLRSNSRLATQAVAGRVVANVKALGSPSHFLAEKRQRLLQLQRYAHLNQLREIVGERPVDVVTTTQAIAWYAGFEIEPRPLLQSYLATERSFALASAAHFAKPDAPPFVLLTHQPLDRRLATSEDNYIWRELVTRYRPVASQSQHVLLERRCEPGNSERALVDEGRLRLDEWRDLPSADGQGLFLELDPKLDIVGKLATAALKAPVLNLQVQTTAAMFTYRLPLEAARSGFLIAPFLVDSPAMTAWLLGLETVAPRRFRVIVAPGQYDLFQPDYDFRLFRDASWVWTQERATACEWQGPVPPGGALEQAFLAQVIRVDDEPALFAHAPSRLRYPLPSGGQYHVRAGFGLSPEVNVRSTDGVTFSIRLMQGTEESVLHRRTLKPQVMADRGTHHVTLPVSAPSGSTLTFVVESGRSHDWDWSYWKDVRIDEED